MNYTDSLQQTDRMDEFLFYRSGDLVADRLLRLFIYTQILGACQRKIGHVDWFTCWFIYRFAHQFIHQTDSFTD